MKALVICTQGGHLTEAEYLVAALENYDLIWITHKSERVHNFSEVYFIPYIGTNLVKMLFAFMMAFKILIKEKPDLIFSTGAEIAIPFFILGKVFGVRSVYVETWTRVDNPTRTGRIVYHFADAFFVQWEEMLSKYGDKARYRGGIL